MTRDGKAPGGNLEPTENPKSESESYTRAHGDMEPEARAAVASWALAAARRESDLARKRAALERARAQLLESLRLVETDLERLSA